LSWDTEVAHIPVCIQPAVVTCSQKAFQAGMLWVGRLLILHRLIGERGRFVGLGLLLLRLELLLLLLLL